MSRIKSTRPDPDSAFPNPKIPSLLPYEQIKAWMGDYELWD